MRIKVVRGSSPGGLCRYLLREDKQRADSQADAAQSSPIFHTNMFGVTAAELAEEFRFSHDLNPRVKLGMVHYAISLPPGENPNTETKQGVVDKLLENRGHTHCQFFAVEHYDQLDKHNVHHFHVAASAVRLDGSWVSSSFERQKLKPIEREIEQELGLTYCPPRAKEEQLNLTTGEYRLKERTKRKLPKEKLWSAIDLAASDQPSMSLFVARLRAQDISVRLRQEQDRTTGISYEVDGVAFPGYKLGKAYSFNGLQKHQGVSYLPEQDQQLIELSQLSAQDAKQLVEEQRAYQQHYDQLYQHYSPRVRLESEQRDRFVVRRALTAGHDASEAAEIIRWSGEQAKMLKHTQGKAAAHQYVTHLTHQEIQQANLAQQKARQREWEMER